MPIVIETCIRLNFPTQFLDNSVTYGLMRMADDRVDNVDDMQKEHATWNAETQNQPGGLFTHSCQLLLKPALV